jgi:dGTP triphosphohydrolase
MDWADDVTYSVHDIEDFYRAGRLPLHLLSKVRDTAERVAFFENVFQRRKGEEYFVRQRRTLKKPSQVSLSAIFLWKKRTPGEPSSEPRSAFFPAT